MSGNTSGALGFVSGLMGGMERREDYERSKRIDRLLDQKSTTALNEDVGAYEQYLNEGGDAENWAFQQQDEDPFLVKQFGKFKNWLTGTEPEAEVDPYQKARESYANRDVAEGSMSPVKDPQPGKLVTYADGGRVDKRRAIDAMDAMDVPGYRPPSRSQQEEELAPRGPASEDPIFPRTRAIGGEVRAENEQLAPQEGDSPYTRGSKWMDRTKNSIKGFLGGSLAFGRDMVDLAVPDAAADFVQGAVGYKGNEDHPSQAIPTGVAPKKATGKGDTPKALAIESAVGEGASDEQMAATAKQTAVAETPGHPQHPDQQFDFGAMAREGWEAGDIAHVPLKDWNEYRQRHVQASIKRGVSVGDANAEVDQLQHAGFLRNFRQASYLMMAGDMAGAALAARAAYQYFPNGADIRFKALTGKDGQEYLVAAGFDEETGEIRGEPQVMTPEYANAMLANFEDSKAFNAWKADKEEAYRLERQYQEIDKPTAQADLDLKGAQTEYYRSGAEKNRAGATGTNKPLTEAEKRGAGQVIAKDVEMLELEDPALARQLKAVAVRIYSETRTEPEVIMNEIRKLHAEYGDEGLNQLVAEWTSE